MIPHQRVNLIENAERRSAEKFIIELTDFKN